VFEAKLPREQISLKIRKGGIHMGNNKDRVYIERRDQGDYAIRKGGADRASGTAPTQREAIEKAEKMFPDQKPMIERVRDTDKAGRDKWRTE
jgi:hypothetical protein